MRPNPVKATLARGGFAFGSSVIEFGSVGLPRIAAVAGADFLLFDTEHNGWTSETLRPLLAVSRAVDTVPLVRVDGLDPRPIGTALDLGAMGIMVPGVETGDEARRIVEYARYPPRGRRGSAFGVAHDDYRSGQRDLSIASADEETLLIALVETAAGISNIDQIVAVPEIDVIWIGQSDLTMSMGIVGQYQDPRYLAAVDRVIDAATGAGKTLGFTVTSLDEGRRMIELGFRCISYWNDVRIYQDSLRAATASLRDFAARTSDDPA